MVEKLGSLPKASANSFKVSKLSGVALPIKAVIASSVYFLAAAIPASPLTDTSLIKSTTSCLV